MNSLRSLFVPTGIAVVGASEKVHKIRGRLLKLLIDGGYKEISILLTPAVM